MDAPMQMVGLVDDFALEQEFSVVQRGHGARSVSPNSSTLTLARVGHSPTRPAIVLPHVYCMYCACCKSQTSLPTSHQPGFSSQMLELGGQDAIHLLGNMDTSMDLFDDGPDSPGPMSPELLFSDHRLQKPSVLFAPEARPLGTFTTIKMETIR